MKKLIAIAAVAVCCLAAVPGTASAGATSDTGWTNYAGKTKEGTKISFTCRKIRIALMDAMLPATCASAQGGTPGPGSRSSTRPTTSC